MNVLIPIEFLKDKECLSQEALLTRAHMHWQCRALLNSAEISHRWGKSCLRESVLVGGLAGWVGGRVGG